jgi:hypothetical protein
MKKILLLSGMIGLGVATGINAITMPKTKKGQLSIEEVQRSKIVGQKLEALENRKPVYKMLDALIVGDIGVVYRQFNNEPREKNALVGYELKNNIDWAAVFHILDSMKGVINVNEYLTPKIVSNNNYEDQYSLLDIAVEQNNLSAAQTLLEIYKANPNQGPYSPFQQALQNRNTPMINLLMQHGGKI